MVKINKCFLLLCIVCTGCTGPTLLYYDRSNYNKFVITQPHWLINFEAIVDKAYTACTSRKMKPRFISRDLGCNTPFCLDSFDRIYFDCESEKNPIATSPAIKLKTDLVGALNNNQAMTKCKDLGFEEPSQKFSECLNRLNQ